MSIRVTCIGCHARFDVSEKFAGKEGPCPKCKKIIQIPTADEQVVVHAPEHTGPKDSKGRSVLKPISRSETDLSRIQMALIAASVILFLALAFILRSMIPDKEGFPIFLLAGGALIIAMPIVYVAYTFLRNQEGAPFFGNDLWSRLGICASIYAALWLLMPLMAYAFPDNGIGAIIGVTGMIAAGGTIGMLVLEFDYLFGVLHYGMYLSICLLGRLIVGLTVLPGGFSRTEQGPSTVISLLESTTILF